MGELINNSIGAEKTREVVATPQKKKHRLANEGGLGTRRSLGEA